MTLYHLKPQHIQQNILKNNMWLIGTYNGGAGCKVGIETIWCRNTKCCIDKVLTEMLGLFSFSTWLLFWIKLYYVCSLKSWKLYRNRSIVKWLSHGSLTAILQVRILLDLLIIFNPFSNGVITNTIKFTYGC